MEKVGNAEEKTGGDPNWGGGTCESRGREGYPFKKKKTVNQENCSLNEKLGQGGKKVWFF